MSRSLIVGIVFLVFPFFVSPSLAASNSCSLYALAMGSGYCATVGSDSFFILGVGPDMGGATTSIADTWTALSWDTSQNVEGVWIPIYTVSQIQPSTQIGTDPNSCYGYANCDISIYTWGTMPGVGYQTFPCTLDSSVSLTGSSYEYVYYCVLEGWTPGNVSIGFDVTSDPAWVGSFGAIALGMPQLDTGFTSLPTSTPTPTVTLTPTVTPTPGPLQGDCGIWYPVAPGIVKWDDPAQIYEGVSFSGCHTWSGTTYAIPSPKHPNGFVSGADTIRLKGSLGTWDDPINAIRFYAIDPAGKGDNAVTQLCDGCTLQFSYQVGGGGSQSCGDPIVGPTVLPDEEDGFVCSLALYNPGSSVDVFAYMTGPSAGGYMIHAEFASLDGGGPPPPGPGEQCITVEMVHYVSSTGGQFTVAEWPEGWHNEVGYSYGGNTWPARFFLDEQFSDGFIRPRNYDAYVWHASLGQVYHHYQLNVYQAAAPEGASDLFIYEATFLTLPQLVDWCPTIDGEPTPTPTPSAPSPTPEPTPTFTLTPTPNATATQQAGATATAWIATATSQIATATARAATATPSATPCFFCSPTPVPSATPTVTPTFVGPPPTGTPLPEDLEVPGRLEELVDVLETRFPFNLYFASQEVFIFEGLDEVEPGGLQVPVILPGDAPPSGTYDPDWMEPEGGLGGTTDYDGVISTHVGLLVVNLEPVGRVSRLISIFLLYLWFFFVYLLRRIRALIGVSGPGGFPTREDMKGE